MQTLPELPDQIGVGERAVAIGRHERMTFDQSVETVTLFRREQRARQAHGTEHVRIEGQPTRRNSPRRKPRSKLAL